MSCQQAARLITTNTAARIREDPYVFTESVPTTPPILFNIQKSRAKVPESISLTKTAKFTNQKLPLAQLNGFTAKTQASLAHSVPNTHAQATTPATTNLKNVTQSQKLQNRKPTTPNVCIVRPQQQRTALPTPSLWQTPLLLDTVVSPPTSPASLPSPTPVASAITPVPSATLPPSNFHHTTFAQHLQKVGCIRKPIQPSNDKTNPKNNKKTNISDSKLCKKDVPDVKSQKSSSLESLQHSDNDLNEIPVNVIYRNPQPTGEIACTLVAGNGNAKLKPQAAVSAQIHNSIDPSSPTTPLLKPEFTKDKATVQLRANRDTSHLQPTTSSTESTPTCISEATTENGLQLNTARCSTLNSQKRRASPPTGKQIPQSQANKKCRRAAKCVERQTNAFAVVTCPTGGLLSSPDTKFPPYYLQQHWLGVYELKTVGEGLLPTCFTVLSPNLGREERIAQHKNLLRRQAVQLLATQKLLQCPLQDARRRLICVDRLLRKHENHCEEDFSARSCILSGCSNQALPMTTHCYEHIGFNVDQHLFLSCTAKFSDNSQCRIPVFDIVHDLPLCTEHARKRDAYNRIWHEQRPRKMSTVTAAVSYDDEFRRQQQLQHTRTYIYNNSSASKQQRNKRKSSVTKPVGRPQKRFRKTTITSQPPPLSAVNHRKSSNTSLESIASNSHSSHSQPPFMTSSTVNVALAPPALAPLSGGRHYQLHQQQHDNAGMGGLSATTGGFNRINFGGSSAASNEINQIVAQFSMVANNNNSNSHTDFSSGLSSLPSADEILTQDMLSICENSSVYASSEDTGVGGLSETELMAGAHDAEEIPLGDTRLLEEHDLANVLNTLPVDAFNELFTAVRQDERDEVERALELADKHLKSLQQTIGSDSDFLGDFLDVNDHMLDDTDICSKMEIVSSVLHSPDTSGIDTASLFADSGTSRGGLGGNCTTSITDIRGLLQT